MNQYEAMFLFDPTFASTADACETEIRRYMERAEGELLFCKKWDDRRLAFRVDGRKRGTYYLTYFNAQPSKIGGIERDVQLSEHALRVLILRADGVTPDMMEAAMSAQKRGTEDSSDRDGDRDRGGSDDDFEERRPRRRSRSPESAHAGDRD